MCVFVSSVQTYDLLNYVASFIFFKGHYLICSYLYHLFLLPPVFLWFWCHFSLKKQGKRKEKKGQRWRFDALFFFLLSASGDFSTSACLPTLPPTLEDLKKEKRKSRPEKRDTFFFRCCLRHNVTGANNGGGEGGGGVTAYLHHCTMACFECREWRSLSSCIVSVCVMAKLLQRLWKNGSALDAD